MKKTKQILSTLTIFVGSLIVLFAYHSLVDRNKANEQLHKRIDVLVRDSVKVHKWIENVKTNYQDLNNLKP